MARISGIDIPKKKRGVVSSLIYMALAKVEQK